MATYKKRGAKKTQSPKGSHSREQTEEVFSNLDTGATRLEQWIAVYQRRFSDWFFESSLLLSVIWNIKVSFLIPNCWSQQWDFSSTRFFEKGLADEERAILFFRTPSGANGKYGFSILLIIMAGHLQPIWRPTIRVWFIHLDEYELRLIS